MVWHIVEPGRTYIDNWHIGAICEHLQAVTEGQIKRLLCNMPPRSMKTLLFSVIWPAWEWIKKPQTRYIYASYAASLSERDALKARRLIESAWYRQRYGEIYKLTSDQNEKKRYENDKTGYRLSTSVGGTGTGEGGDRIVADDPHNAIEIHSPAARREVITWWSETMSTRGNDPATMAHVVVMQRLHQQDLSGYLIDLGTYDHLCLPMEYEGSGKLTSIGWIDPREKAGELLWPSRFDREYVNALKLTLRSAASGQLQQRPSPPEGAIIKREWFKFYLIAPSEWDQIIMSWDLTFKNSTDADWVVGQVWGRAGANKYLLDQVRDRMGFVETRRAFRRLCDKWPQATAKLIEDKANGPAIIDSLREEISGIVAINPKDSKLARVEATSPQIEGGNVYLPEHAPWIHDFIEEFLMFPNGAHDDQVDTATQALNYLARNERAGQVASVGETIYGSGNYGFSDRTGIASSTSSGGRIF